MDIKPINGNILIEVKKQPTETESGFILPENTKIALEEAEIVALDPDIQHMKVGDTIYYKLYSLSTVEVNKKEYAFLNESDVLAIK